jgi:hypothetical protein
MSAALPIMPEHLIGDLYERIVRISFPPRCYGLFPLPFRS